jgi:hypothetical protein
MMKIKFIVAFSLLASLSFGQIDSYNYKRKVSGNTDEWHRVEIPNALFSKVSSNFNDIRFYGITSSKDTVEAAYFLQLQEAEITASEIEYELLNSVKNENGYYYTFKIPTGKTINEIDLDFSLDNYDWNISLEGSQDQLNWFTVVKDYRILSISNTHMRYSYSRVAFPKTEYRYFKLFVPSHLDPKLIMPKVRMNSIVNGKARNYKAASHNIRDDKKRKETIIDIALEQSVPVSSIRINSSDKFDFYRNVLIEYLYDSTKTEKGYIKNYVDLTQGVLSSIEQNDFHISNVIAKNIRIRIYNDDNQPLNISSVQVKGTVHELVVRFTEEANYFLVYGNATAVQPNYDINHFKSKIPKTLTALTLDTEEFTLNENYSTENSTDDEAFLGKNWIWFVMTIIIVILGWFTFKMMRSEDQSRNS